MLKTEQKHGAQSTIATLIYKEVTKTKNWIFNLAIEKNHPKVHEDYP